MKDLGVDVVMATFGVGQAPATLGLTLFVAGYGLGPMVGTATFVFKWHKLTLERSGHRCQRFHKSAVIRSTLPH